MTPEEVEQAIATARDNRSTELSFKGQEIFFLPDSIGDLINLTSLKIYRSKLTILPGSIGNLTNLNALNLYENQLTGLPNTIGNFINLSRLDLSVNRLTNISNAIGNLANLTSLYLSSNQLTSLPESIGSLTNLTSLYLGGNQLTSLPESMTSLTNLTSLYLGDNQLTSLPESMTSLTNLTSLNLNSNHLIDLSILANIHSLETVNFFDVDLPRRYWTKFSDWKPEWLLDEDNAEIRRTLIAQVGYEKICDELNAINLDTWREYTLLKIDDAEKFYGVEDDEPTIDREPIGTEAMVLLKMTCPSTAYIHVLRVPPEMTSAEAAITWVNHGIHPDEFAVQT